VPPLPGYFPGQRDGSFLLPTIHLALCTMHIAQRILFSIKYPVAGSWVKEVSAEKRAA